MQEKNKIYTSIIDVRENLITVILLNVELRQVFIRNLKYYRKEKKLRQLDLAIEIGKSSNYINSIENGKYFPSPETIEKISDFLKIEPMQLFDKKNPCDKQNEFCDAIILQKIQNHLKNEVIKNIELAFDKISDKDNLSDTE